MADRPQVLIVGAGIIGASIAWHLVRAGARVTVTEAGEPGGIATRNSWAWINASWGNPEPYFRLRVRAMDEWRRLEQEVSGIRVAWVGGLFWELPPEQLETFAVEHAAWGYDIRRVERAEVQRIEPHLATPPRRARLRRPLWSDRRRLRRGSWNSGRYAWYIRWFPHVWLLCCIRSGR